MSCRRRQNRKSAGKKQPFPSQFFKCRAGCGRLGNDDNECVVGKFPEGCTDHFTDPPTDFVADNCPADPLGRDNPDFWPRDVVSSEDGNAKEPSMAHAPRLANEGEIPGIPEVGRLWKPLPLRRRCGGQSGLRHPLAGDACAPAGGGGSGWRGPPWFSSGRESRTAACACAWRAGKCVS